MSANQDSPGLKYDGEKPELGLLSRYMIEEVGKVLTFGGQKYGKHNWRLGIQVQRNINAALRHIFAANEKEAKKVKEVMEDCVQLEVPSKVDIEFNETWGG